jgi:hypothetical protein
MFSRGEKPIKREDSPKENTEGMSDGSPMQGNYISNSCLMGGNSVKAKNRN